MYIWVQSYYHVLIKLLKNCQWLPFDKLLSFCWLSQWSWPSMEHYLG